MEKGAGEMQHIMVHEHRANLLRRSILFGTPLMLGLLEIGHPLLDHMHPIKTVAPIASWWIILHVLQIPLFGLMGCAFFLLLQGIHNRAANLSRCAVIIYISFAIGYDTVAGLSTGILVSNARILPIAQQTVMQYSIRQLLASPAIDFSYLVLIIAGSVSICATAWALFGAGIPLLPLFVLLGSLVTVYSHAVPFGPIGNAFFLLAVLWIELERQRLSDKEKNLEQVLPASEVPKNDDMHVLSREGS